LYNTTAMLQMIWPAAIPTPIHTTTTTT